MRDSEPYVGCGVGRTGDCGQVVVAEVRVVDPREREPGLADRQRGQRGW